MRRDRRIGLSRGPDLPAKIRIIHDSPVNVPKRKNSALFPDRPNRSLIINLESMESAQLDAGQQVLHGPRDSALSWCRRRFIDSLKADSFEEFHGQAADACRSVREGNHRAHRRLDTLPVDIVVPVHNEEDLTRQFLASLKKETTHPYRLILVDNGSEALPKSLIQDFEDALWVRCDENLGFSGGSNAGIRAGNNPLVAVLNNDLLLTPGWLTRLHDALLRAPNIGAAAACSNYAIDDQQVEIGFFNDTESMQAKAAAFTKRNARLIEDVPFVSGMCLLMKRELLERTGLFDEQYGPGNFEDNDLCLRIKQKGQRIVVARDVFVYHIGNRTFRQLGIDYQAQMSKNHALFLAKWKHDPYVRGCQLENKGDLDGALQCFLKSMKEGDPNPEPFLRTGFILLSAGRYETAARAFLQYITQCPDATRARLGLGSAYYLAGETQKGMSLIQAIFRRRYVRDDIKKSIQKMIHCVSPDPCKEDAWLCLTGEGLSR